MCALMIEQPIRQATEEQILLLLRDRQGELRLLFDEPLATFSMPVERRPRILVTLPHPPAWDDSPWFVTIDERTVRVPVQLTIAHEPVPCLNDPGTRLSIAIKRRQALAETP